jgi:hypothetical protein
MNSIGGIIFPGVCLNKSLHVKIEETKNFFHTVEPIIAEIIERERDETFYLDESNPSNFDSTSLQTAGKSINKIFYDHSALSKAHSNLY